MRPLETLSELQTLMEDSPASSLTSTDKLSHIRVISLSLLALIAFQSAPTFAKDDYEPGIHGFVTIATDNRFRGNSLTAGDPGLIADFDIVTSKYLYAGVQSSNIGNVNLNSLLRQAKLTLYGGAKGAILEKLNFDFRYSHNLNYDIRNERKLPGTYGEVYFGVETHGLKAAIAYSNDFQFSTGKYLYPSVGFDLGLFGIVDLNLHAGYNRYLDDTMANASNTNPIRPGIPDYVDWKAGITLNIFSSTKVSIAVIGTDLSDDYCGPLQSCDPKFVFSLTKVL